MKNTPLLSALLLALVVIPATRIRASDDDARSDSPGIVAFEQVKTLFGEWRTPEGKEMMINIFRPMAFGSAVIHEEWKRGEQLTATVFYVVGDELRADHFCDFKNQLHYVVKPSPDRSGLIFELRDATNLDVSPRHFHSTTWKFVDATHLTQDWHIEGGGKEPATAHLDFTRQK